MDTGTLVHDATPASARAATISQYRRKGLQNLARMGGGLRGREHDRTRTQPSRRWDERGAISLSASMTAGDQPVQRVSLFFCPTLTGREIARASPPRRARSVVIRATVAKSM